MVVIEREALYTVAELAAALGVGAPAVREWIREGKLPAIKPGKEYLIRGADLLDMPRAKPGRKAATDV